MRPSRAWHQSPSQRHTARAGHSEGDRREGFERNTCRTPNPQQHAPFSHGQEPQSLWWATLRAGSRAGPGHRRWPRPHWERCPSGEVSLCRNVHLPGLTHPHNPRTKICTPRFAAVRSQPLARRPHFSLHHLLWLVATTSSEERAEIKMTGQHLQIVGTRGGGCKMFS